MNAIAHRIILILLLHASILAANPQTTVELPGGMTMDLVWVEPGRFSMGLSDPEARELFGYNGDSGISSMRPPHEVTISTGFWMGKYEVTASQWEAVMATTLNHQSREADVAVVASSLAIDEFLWRLNANAGSGRFRLPTEAEWEYACRAGTTTIWSFGDIEQRPGRQRYMQPGCRPDGTGWLICGPETIGQREPNPWGLHDMHGNVEEMTGDGLRSYDAGPQLDPFTAPGQGDSLRVLRGSRDAPRFSPPPPAEELRISAYRREGSSAGFRIVLTGQDTVLRADAGRYRWVAAGQLVRLDGSASVGPTDLSYAWEEHPDNPETGILHDPSSPQPAFSASRLGEYKFVLRVSDGTFVSEAHEVRIEVVGVSTDGVVTLTVADDVQMEFVWIEPAQRSMGYGDELERLLRDSGLWDAALATDPTSMSRLARPAHQVTLTQGFYLARYELTQAQWTGLTGSRPWADPTSDCTAPDDPDHPAVCVSYNRIVGILDGLNRTQRRRRIHLPTEAQWEHAALTGSTHLWFFGSEPSLLAEHAWYATNTPDETPRPVGLKLPNRWGLHDMDGNVREWCLDQFAAYDEDDLTNPAGPYMPVWDRKPVQRGGDVRLPPVSSRERFPGVASAVSAYVGARLVAYGPPMESPVGVALYDLDEVPPTLPLDPAGYPAPGQPLNLELDDGFDTRTTTAWSFIENRGEEAVWHQDLWSVVSRTFRLNSVKMYSAVYHSGPDVTNYILETRVRVTGGEGWVLFTHADEQPFWRLSLNEGEQTVQLLTSQEREWLLLPPAPGDHASPRSPSAWTKPWPLHREWHAVRIDVRTNTMDVAIDGVSAFADVPLGVRPNAVIGLGGIGDREPNVRPVATDKLVYFDDVRLWHGVAATGAGGTTGGASGSLLTTYVHSAPNPFHTEVVLTYGFAGTGSARLTIYDVAGQRIWQRPLPTSTGTLRWDGRNDAGQQVSSGVYFAVVRGGGLQRSQRMVLIR